MVAWVICSLAESMRLNSSEGKAIALLPFLRGRLVVAWSFKKLLVDFWENFAEIYIRSLECLAGALPKPVSLVDRGPFDGF